MASGNTPPPFPSPVIQTIDQKPPHVNTTVDAPPSFGGPNPMAAYQIPSQPLSQGDLFHVNQSSLNQFSGGSVDRGLDDRSWYSNDGQPPSVGAIRPGVMSHPSGGNQMYSGGQPPSLNDMGRRDTSQTGGMSTGGEAPEAYEFAGMSLTGGNFRRFHPDAFNKDKYGGK